MPTPIHIQNFLTPPSTQLSTFPNRDGSNEINQLIICNGVDNTFKDGLLIKDLGYEKIGDTLQTGKEITGMFDFRQSSTIQKIL